MSSFDTFFPFIPSFSVPHKILMFSFLYHYPPLFFHFTLYVSWVFFFFALYSWYYLFFPQDIHTFFFFFFFAFFVFLLPFPTKSIPFLFYLLSILLAGFFFFFFFFFHGLPSTKFRSFLAWQGFAEKGERKCLNKIGFVFFLLPEECILYREWSLTLFSFLWKEYIVRRSAKIYFSCSIGRWKEGICAKSHG